MGESRPSPGPQPARVTLGRGVRGGPSGRQQTLLVYRLREVSQKVEEPDLPWPGLSRCSQGHGAFDVGE